MQITNEVCLMTDALRSQVAIALINEDFWPNLNSPHYSKSGINIRIQEICDDRDAHEYLDDLVESPNVILNPSLNLRISYNPQERKQKDYIDTLNKIGVSLRKMGKQAHIYIMKPDPSDIGGELFCYDLK